MPVAPVWTEEQLKLLHEMAADGHNTAEMAEKIGRPIKAIYSKLRKLNLEFRKRPRGYEKPRGDITYSYMGGIQRKSDYGYLPEAQHPDWSKVRFR